MKIIGKNLKISEKIGKFRKKSEKIGKNWKILEEIGKFRKKSEKFGKNWKILEEIGKFRKKSDIFVEKRAAGFLAQRVCQYSFLISFMIE